MVKREKIERFSLFLLREGLQRLKSNWISEKMFQVGKSKYKDEVRKSVRV